MYKDQIGLLSLDDYFDEYESDQGSLEEENKQDKNLDLGSQEKVENEGEEINLKIDFATAEQLDLIKEYLEDPVNMKEISQGVVNQGITQFWGLMKLVNYLQIEEIRNELKSAFFEKVNAISISEPNLPEHSALKTKAQRLKEFLGFHSLQKKAMHPDLEKDIVLNSRLINGQVFPTIMKFEEFYNGNVSNNHSVLKGVEERRENKLFGL